MGEEMLTKEREAELRKIHGDNRYGVLELLDEIEKLKSALENTKETLSLIAEGEGSDESVYMAMGKAALAKIEELGV